MNQQLSMPWQNTGIRSFISQQINLFLKSFKPKWHTISRLFVPQTTQNDPEVTMSQIINNEKLQTKYCMVFYILWKAWQCSHQKLEVCIGEK